MKPGTRTETKARSTGTTVILCPASDEGVESDGKWLLICDPHGGCVNLPTLAEARAFRAAPEEWCPYCQEQRCSTCGGTVGVYSGDEVDEQWTCSRCGDEWPAVDTDLRAS